jgi:hypothetical protein
MRVPFINGQDLEHLHRRKDGTNFFGKSTGQPIFDQNGEVSQYFAMIEDITETKNADYRRIESETDFLFFLLICKQELEMKTEKFYLQIKKFCSMFDFDEIRRL